MRKLIFRGDIYYVKTEEKWKPAVVVSNDRNNVYSEVVEVVYVTNRRKKELPTHVGTRATGMDATILCEQVDSVNKAQIGAYIGCLGEDDMGKVDQALSISLGL